MPKRLLTQSSPGLLSWPCPQAASDATLGTRFSLPFDPRRSVARWPACPGSGKRNVISSWRGRLFCQPFLHSGDQLRSKPGICQRPYAQPGRMVRLCVHQVEHS